jgi:hypothetical protein
MSENTSETTAVAVEAPAYVAPARKDFTNLRNRPFLVVNTIQRPVRPSITRVKGWADTEANWSIFENPYVVDRVSNKIMREATVIIDIMRSSVIKSRFTNPTDDEVVVHYMEKYREQVKEAMDLWLTKMASRMAADPNFAKPSEALTQAMAAKFKVVADEAPTTDTKEG